MLRQICCIGAGYVGGPTSAVIASKNPDISLHVVDLDDRRIQAWKSNELPVNEPGLLSLVRIGRDGSDGRTPNLHFSTDISRAVREADLIFIAVNTPPKTSGRGTSQALDISHVEAAVEAIAQHSTSDKIVVEKSTVPCGTSDHLRRLLTALGRPGVCFDVLSNPEFLAEGTAIKNLLQPDRVLIGYKQDVRGLRAAELLTSIYASWVARDRIILMNTHSVELTKLAANALLAQRISSINALSVMCERLGADVEEVAMALGMDARIGPAMLKASLGFGGSCFKKDILALTHTSEELGLEQIGSYWRSINDVNEFQKSRFTAKIVNKMNNTLVGKKIALLGCSFKTGTGDVRDSAGVSLMADLLEEKARVAIYDPAVRLPELLQALPRSSVYNGLCVSGEREFDMYTSPYAACDGAHAVVIATAWDEFSNRSRSADLTTTPSTSSDLVQRTVRIDWSRIVDRMRHPKLFFDGCNIINEPELRELGFEVHGIGKASY